MKVLLASAELLGYAKAGGLADITYGLAAALSRMGVKLSVVVPLYGFAKNIEAFEEISLGGITFLHAEFDGLDVYFVKDEVFNGDCIYCSASGVFEGVHLRFAFFSRAILHLAQSMGFDVVHLNDWHTALAAYYLKANGFGGRVVLSIHNLSYQGIFDVSPEEVGIPKEYFNPDYFEFYGKLNILKGGIAFADRIVFVSDAYLKEALAGVFDFGLAGFLNRHKDKLSAILNGIDYGKFDPKNDIYIYEPYTAGNLRGKFRNKQRFTKELGLSCSKGALFSFIGRLVEQKGVDLILESLQDILSRDLNFVVLGDGDRDICNRFESFNAFNFKILCGYNEQMARRIYAASDFIVVPSVFEPCGLVQLIGFRYGCIPVVHGVGGLKQTVHDINDKECGLGFVYESQTKDGLLSRIDAALDLYKNKQRLGKIRRFNMSCDFGVERTAREYLSVYGFVGG